jgi:hypothetical protein
VTAHYGSAAANASGNGGLVGCWPENDRMRISFPYALDDHLRDASALLGADFVAIRDPFRGDLTPAGLAALAAAVDLLRRRLFESLLRRQAQVSMEMSSQDLLGTYAEGRSAADARWLVTLLHLLMPASVPLPERISDDGLRELTRCALLEEVGGAWRAAEPLRRRASYLKNPLPAIAHEVVALDGRDLRVYRYLIALRGDGPVWTLLFERDAEGGPRIALRSRTGAGYRKALAEILEPAYAAPGPAAAPEAKPQPQPRRCTKCGAPIRDDHAFCTKCGQRQG